MISTGKSEVRISMVIRLAGAFCTFLIGAGFATGQEVMQYFTNYGIAKAVGMHDYRGAGVLRIVSALRDSGEHRDTCRWLRRTAGLAVHNLARYQADKSLAGR